MPVRSGRRRRPRVARRRRADAAAPAADGLRVPGLPRAAVPHASARTSRCRSRCSGSRRSRRRRAGGAMLARGRPRRPGRQPPARAVRRRAAAGRDRARARPSPARWCSPTSRPATSTRTARAIVLALLRAVHQGPGRGGHPGHALAGRRADHRPDAAADARRHARTGIAMSAVAARSIRIGVAATLLRGAFAEQRLRALLGIGAIALGVALGYAVQLINAAAIGEITPQRADALRQRRPRGHRASERLRRGPLPAARAPCRRGRRESGGRGRGGAVGARRRIADRRCRRLRGRAARPGVGSRGVRPVRPLPAGRAVPVAGGGSLARGRCGRYARGAERPRRRRACASRGCCEPPAASAMR